MVQQTTVDFQYKITLLLTTIGLISFQYHALFNILCIMISQIIFSLIGALIHKDEHAVGNFFANVCNLTVMIVPAAMLVERAMLEYS